MTGFGKHIVQLPTKKITVELKSLNSKNLDINARMPSAYREKELELRKMIARVLVRGKVDFGLYVEITGGESPSEVNKAVVSEYMNQLRGIAEGDELRLLEMAIRLPDALKTDRDDIDETEYQSIREAVEGALKDIVGFRKEEGQVLEKDFLKRIGLLRNLKNAVDEIDPERLALSLIHI